jgi:hypothetical protein
MASLFMGFFLYCASAWLGNDVQQISYIIGEVIGGIMIYCLAIFLLKTFSAHELGYLKKLMFKGDR